MTYDYNTCRVICRRAVSRYSVYIRNDNKTHAHI